MNLFHRFLKRDCKGTTFFYTSKFFHTFFRFFCTFLYFFAKNHSKSPFSTKNNLNNSIWCATKLLRHQNTSYIIRKRILYQESWKRPIFLGPYISFYRISRKVALSWRRYGTRQAERAHGVARAACLEPMAGVFAIGVAAQKNVEAKVLHTSTIQKVAAPSEGNRLSVIAWGWVVYAPQRELPSWLPRVPCCVHLSVQKISKAR